MQNANNKRKTLKKITGASAVVALAPSSWTKPIVNSVLLPAHAQTSANQAPTISGVSCTFDTPTLQVGSVITMEATISDVDNPMEDINWGIRNSNSGLIATGEGQFTTTTYTVVEGDVGNLVLELEVFDGTGNSTTETLCDDTVSLTCQITVTPDPTTPFTRVETIGLDTQIIATNGPGTPIIVNYTTTAPRSVSVTSHTFSPMISGESETLTVDVLDGSTVICTHSTTVTWADAPADDCPTGNDVVLNAGFSDGVTFDLAPEINNPDGSNGDLVATVLSAPSNGSVVFNTNTEFIYEVTDGSGFGGSDTFTYVIEDMSNSGVCSRGTGRVTINDIIDS